MNQSGKMYSYFLSDYINTIVDKDKRKLKDLSKGEIAQLIILILGVSFVFVTTIFYQLGKTSFHFWLELIAIICLYIVIGTIIYCCKARSRIYFQSMFLICFIPCFKVVIIF